MLSAGVGGLVREAGADLATLLRHPVYVCTIAGQTLYTGAAQENADYECLQASAPLPHKLPPLVQLPAHLNAGYSMQND